MFLSFQDEEAWEHHEGSIQTAVVLAEDSASRPTNHHKWLLSSYRREKRCDKRKECILYWVTRCMQNVYFLYWRFRCNSSWSRSIHTSVWNIYSLCDKLSLNIPQRVYVFYIDLLSELTPMKSTRLLCKALNNLLQGECEFYMEKRSLYDTFILLLLPI